MSVPFICILVAAAFAVVALGIYVRSAAKRRNVRRDVEARIEELRKQLDVLKPRLKTVELASLPRWAVHLKNALVKDMTACLRAADLSLGNASRAGCYPSPTAQENLAIVQAAIGLDVKGSFFKVIDENIVSIKDAHKQLEKFRNKMHKHLVTAFGADTSNEHVRAVDELGRRIDWNMSDGRPLTEQLAVVTQMVMCAGLLDCAILGLGEKKKWQNGLLRFRVEGAVVRLAVVQTAKQVLQRIYDFRVMRGERPEEALEAAVRLGGLQRARTYLIDAANYVKNDSRDQEEILAEIISAETILMGAESVLSEALDPHGTTAQEYAQAKAGARQDWKLDIHRTSQRVA